jgi:hypothetical protein
MCYASTSHFVSASTVPSREIQVSFLWKATHLEKVYYVLAKQCSLTLYRTPLLFQSIDLLGYVPH